MSPHHGLKKGVVLCAKWSVCVYMSVSVCVCAEKSLACPVPHASPGNLRCHIFPWQRWILTFFISTKIRLLANFPFESLRSLNHSRYPAVIKWLRYYLEMMIDWLDRLRLRAVREGENGDLIICSTTQPSRIKEPKKKPWFQKRFFLSVLFLSFFFLNSKVERFQIN